MYQQATATNEITDQAVGAAEAPAAAQAMLDALVSVGAEAFDVTWTNRRGGLMEYSGGYSPGDLTGSLAYHLQRAAGNQWNLIIRPNARTNVLVQLDDLDQAALDRVRSVAFLGLGTSPGNFQAWVALPAEAADRDLSRELRRSAGADQNASGAARIAGSLNFKDKYAPDFPRVGIVFTASGLVTDRSQLEAIGLVAKPQIIAPAVVCPPPALIPAARPPAAWPRYQYSLKGAPQNGDGTGPDRSKADFVWCMTAIDWGWTVEESAAHLMKVSDKAQENGQGYASTTAQNAAAAVARRHGIGWYNSAIGGRRQECSR